MKNVIYKIRLVFSLIILMLAMAGIIGVFYPLPFFDIQLVPLLQRLIVDFMISAAVIFVIIILFTLLFGRLYCSILCPFGSLQEIICLITGKNNKKQSNSTVKYFIASITTGIMAGGSAVVIRYIEPYTYFGSLMTLSLTGIIAFIAVGILAFFKKRYFCTNICPIGTILGLISKISLFKIYIDKQKCLSCGICERNCPSGCIDFAHSFVDNEMCVKCLKCIEKCPKSVIKYGIKPKEEVKFNIKRRELITFTAAIAVFLGAIKTGAVILDKTVKKYKDIILPPGAVNAERMQNKCLNCNLCVQSCPNNIIKKADKNFPAVYIDYSKGKKYCKYDCIECSRVCPSGAVKKIPLKEKQKTRIAIAVINSEKCTHCGICINECPVKAISKEESGIAIINASKCIGCGACKKSCHFGAIDIFAVKEQKVL